MDLHKIIAKFLRESADNIENNTCGLTNDELLDLATSIIHIEMNKTEASEYLNMSTRSFDRHIEKGELPQGVHVRGNKNLTWFKDELINYAFNNNTCTSSNFTQR